eukprot:1499929-Rhodomonas_salina.2
MRMETAKGRWDRTVWGDEQQYGKGGKTMGEREEGRGRGAVEEEEEGKAGGREGVRRGRKARRRESDVEGTDISGEITAHQSGQLNSCDGSDLLAAAAAALAAAAAAAVVISAAAAAATSTCADDASDDVNVAFAACVRCVRLQAEPSRCLDAGRRPCREAPAWRSDPGQPTSRATSQE